MSQWTDFRDSLLDGIKFDEVTEEMKQDLNAWILETAMPVAENSASDFINQVTAQAKNESGWCKVRDLVVLPFVIKIGLYIAKKALSQTAVKAV